MNIAIIGILFTLKLWVLGFIGWVAALVMIHTVISVTLFEYSWKLTERHRLPVEARDKLFPAFRRSDAVHWKKWEFIPGVLFFWSIRFATVLGVFALSAWCWLLNLGTDTKKPLTGWKAWANVKAFRACALNLMVWGGWSLSFRQNYIDIDYSFYLGPGYKATQQLPTRAPTVVSNHVSWADSLLLEYSDLAPSFSAKIEAMKVWCLNIILVGNRGIFIARGGTDAERQKNINQIIERQQLVLENPELPPIVVYAECTQTNGTALLEFKKGAFVGMMPCTPVVLSYATKPGQVSPNWASIPFVAHMFLFLSNPYLLNARVDILPVFKPNEYLLKTHRDKGNDDWEIYAWAVRDIMARHGGFDKCEMPIREKLVYKDFMCGKTDEFSYKNTHFSAEPLYAKKVKKD